MVLIVASDEQFNRGSDTGRGEAGEWLLSCLIKKLFVLGGDYSTDCDRSSWPTLLGRHRSHGSQNSNGRQKAGRAFDASPS